LSFCDKNFFQEKFFKEKIWRGLEKIVMRKKLKEKFLRIFFEETTFASKIK